MSNVTHADIRELIDEQGQWFVSIYLPMHVSGEQNRQAPMRFKTLLRDAKADVLQRGMDEDTAKRFFAPAAALVDNRDFWREGGQATAILIGTSGVKSYRLPDTCDEFVAVGKAYHVVPLIAAANAARPYFLLAVSQNRVRLLRGDRDELGEVEIDELPKHGLASLGYDEPEERSQTHSASPQLAGKQSVVFHGQGGAADAAKGEVESYLRLVDRAIRRTVEQFALPLIFVGVDYLLPIYREVNSTSRLWPQHLSGNPDRMSAQELRGKALELLAAQDGRWRTELDAYWRASSAGRTENRDEQTVRAAHEGRVETLFVDPAVRKWGLFDSVTDTIRFDPQPRDDSEDLVNAAAVATLRHEGVVATVTAGYVPGGGVMAATLRYAAEVPAGSTGPS